jgi:hypothetical protein
MENEIARLMIQKIQVQAHSRSEDANLQNRLQ